MNKRIAKKIVKLSSPEKYSENQVWAALKICGKILSGKSAEELLHIRWLFRRHGKYGKERRVPVPEALQQAQDDMVFERHEWRRREG